MDRNLSRRVEAVTPIRVRHLRERLWEDLSVQLEDRRNAWQMQPDGTYERLEAGEDASEVAREGTHATHMKRTRARLRR
jgi:polyphosphate kinase